MSDCFKPDIAIDKSSPESLFFQLVAQITDNLRNQRPREGVKFLPENILAKELGLTRPTVHRAYEELVSKGLLEKHDGKRGVFIAPALNKKLRSSFPAIGIVIPERFSSFMQTKTNYKQTVLNGIIDRASELNYTVMMLQLPELDASEEAIKKWIDFYSNRLDGIIHLGARGFHVDKPLEMILQTKQLPQVFYSGACNMPNVGSIQCDISSALESLAFYLAENGHKRIALIGHFRSKTVMFPYLEYEDVNRTAKALKIFKKHNFIVKDEWCFSGWSESGDEDALFNVNLTKKLQYFMELKKSEAPSVIFCRRDRTAREVIKILQQMNKSVPKDISIIGCDGTNDIENSRYDLTTLRLPYYTMATQCVDNLLAYPEVIKSTLKPSSLQIRASVANLNNI